MKKRKNKKGQKSSSIILTNCPKVKVRLCKNGNTIITIPNMK